jgi:hypothetical protein
VSCGQSLNTTYSRNYFVFECNGSSGNDLIDDPAPMPMIKTFLIFKMSSTISLRTRRHFFETYPTKAGV